MPKKKINQGKQSSKHTQTFQDTTNTDLSQAEGELHPSFQREPPRGGHCHCLSKRDTEEKEECRFIFHQGRTKSGTDQNETVGEDVPAVRSH